MMQLELNTRQEQRLELTPQMRQSLQVLRMGACDLLEAITQQLEDNPLLEVDGDWTSPTLYTKSGPCPLEETVADEPHALYRELMLQLHLSAKNAAQKKIGAYILGNLDEMGYLREPTEAICKALNASQEDVLSAIRMVQSFEPAGICARSLRECLYLQLKRLPVRQCLCEKIVKHHLDDLAKQHYQLIAEETGATKEDVLLAAQRIRSLNPRPGASLSMEAAYHIIPDIQVIIENGQLHVQYIHDMPRLKISDLYSTYLQAENDSIRAYVRAELNEARQFVSAIQKRVTTLSRIAAYIVAHQSAFFLQGEALAPLTLVEVAEALHMHVSTISRGIHEKYLLFAGRVYGLDEFFPIRLNSGNSSAEASARILQLIHQEDKSKPLSDHKIAEMLQEEGITLARRTVAKYRTQAHIPNAGCRRTR